MYENLGKLKIKICFYSINLR